MWPPCPFRRGGHQFPRLSQRVQALAPTAQITAPGQVRTQTIPNGVRPSLHSDLVPSSTLYNQSRRLRRMLACVEGGLGASWPSAAWKVCLCQASQIPQEVMLQQTSLDGLAFCPCPCPCRCLRGRRLPRLPCHAARQPKLQQHIHHSSAQLLQVEREPQRLLPRASRKKHSGDLQPLAESALGGPLLHGPGP